MTGTKRTRTWPMWVFGCPWPAGFLIYTFLTVDMAWWADIVTVILLVGLVVSTWWQARNVKRKAAAGHAAP